MDKNAFRDKVLLLLLVAVALGLPPLINGYDAVAGRENLPKNAKVFTLTGQAERGWILGKMRAVDVVAPFFTGQRVSMPILHVSKGDTVVLRLTSSDVVHGFSLKGLGIFVNEGIQPGKVTTVEFIADKAGVFPFACNSICGNHHENMKGVLVVDA